ncbi:hypothetical protein [Roseicella frigidaeris]|uniref:Uncharacterized protein n=1 Tax=Roseicella frigidaeris TaxID=2230885 RepID=A0A327M3J0_9PROT|nr:hypothetical protein [Roseicella frigidaeris]RAI57309.1 hypothetical protein DOO78_20010 [Roseicella frigidaeris]
MPFDLMPPGTAMEHPHQQQINALALTLGTLVGMLQQKGVLRGAEVSQVFHVAEHLLAEDFTLGHEMIATVRDLAISIGGATERLAASRHEPFHGGDAW